MNRHQRKTLQALFTQPTPGNIRWPEVEALLNALGATIRERAGSRVAVRLHDRIAVFHRPHPNPDMDKGAVRDVRRFLENAGVRP